MRARLRIINGLLLGGLALCTASCDQSPEGARQALRQQHVPRVQKLFADDALRYQQGLAKAVLRVAPALEVEAVSAKSEDKDDEGGVARYRHVRNVLERMRHPKAGISSFVAAPIGFIAVVANDGVVIARDGEHDRLRGRDFGKAYPVVRRCLSEGAAGQGVGVFAQPASKGAGTDAKAGEAGASWLIAAPVRGAKGVTGAVVLGIPLWRLARRLSRQLQLERSDKGPQVLWVYIQNQDQLAAPELGLELTSALAQQTRGTRGQLLQRGRKYVWERIALKGLTDVDALVVRSQN